MRSWFPWIIAAALAAALLYQCQREPASLGRAVAENRVSVTVDSFDDHRDRVRVTVTRQPGVSGRITAVLPVGTIINNRYPKGQRLMTAAGMTLILQPDEDSTSATVEVYCLDQFDLRPGAGTPLALALAETSEGDVTEYEETEPVRKLDACLENQGFPHKAKQVAIWMVAGGYLDQDYSRVREALLQKQLDITRSEAEKHFPGFAARTRDLLTLHNFPADKIEKRLAHYHDEVMGEQVNKKAEDETSRLLFQFRDTLLTLSPCIDDVNGKRFFSSAPADSN